ncbi:putative ankyrin repeat protein [Nemania sp. FL0031]|nr:putative ankyrin repeat protein [Nemania sp. FL0031]
MAQGQLEAEASASSSGLDAVIDVETKDHDADNAKTTTADLFSQKEGGSSPCSHSKQHKLGLDINRPWGWSGSSYDDYDVITVHGLRDDYKTAWTDKWGAWWVKNHLFKNLSIREIDYSYEVDEESTIYQWNGIRLHAERLIEEYAKVRRNLEEIETDRPVIWICHDIGGIIAKEALSIAISNPSKYGKIAILTSAIIFLGTPHRSRLRNHIVDQLLELIFLLPGPEIREELVSKVTHLADQVDIVNLRFLETKILDRSTIFNIFTQKRRSGLKKRAIGDDIGTMIELGIADSQANSITPFPRYAHAIGHAFEAAGKYQLDIQDHIDIVRGQLPDDRWFDSVSSGFNASGSPIKVDHRIIQFQTQILSLAPPTRTIDSYHDPTQPEPPVMTWIKRQAAYVSFSKPGNGVTLMHLHGDGNSSIDISELSRLFYVNLDASVVCSPRLNKPYKTVIYFEFDQRDSRYNTVSAMLTYLINSLIWRFWKNSVTTITEELVFLNSTRSWSLEDLYHLYSLLGPFNPAAQELTFFIACFDQCPRDQRQWFLRRVMQEQSYRDAKYRIIMSTSNMDGLVVESYPHSARINLADWATVDTSSAGLPRNSDADLTGLIARYETHRRFEPEIGSLFRECHDRGMPHLRPLILTWLEHYSQGKRDSDIADKIASLSPVTPDSIVKVFFSSMDTQIKSRAACVFNWIKHALEPWSQESLIDALAVYEVGDDDFSSVSKSIEASFGEITKGFGGIIVMENRDIKFSHLSFYNSPEIGIEGLAEDWASRVHSTIAETCLRYFQLGTVQAMLNEFCLDSLEGGPWDTPLTAAVISYHRTNMMEYAVRFWPQHYKASGQFKPRGLVQELFKSKGPRAAWEVPFWLFSNTFTRVSRTYISTLPVFAMLGLDDLVEEKIKYEWGQPSFQKNCWFAITEAVRMGNNEIARRLLEQVTVDEEELEVAMFWAAATSNTAIASLLVAKITSLEMFQWPDGILFRAAAIGLDDLLTVMLRSNNGNINKIGSYWKAPLGVIAARWNRVSTMNVLLDSEPRLDLAVKDSYGDDAILAAAKLGNPRMITLLLQHAASIETTNKQGLGLVQIAVNWCNHKATSILINAGADFKSGKTGENASTPPLVIASGTGSLECARVLLHNGANPNVECTTGSALYQAVAGNHEDIVRLLLEHSPELDMGVNPMGQEMLLIRAVSTGNTGLVLLLIDHGATIDFVDPNGGTLGTPLSRASWEGNLEMVKLLLEKGASINYTGGGSDTPLLASLDRAPKCEVTELLLQHDDIDVTWAANDGWDALHFAVGVPRIIRRLLEKGAPIDGQSKFGTVLHQASARGYPKSIQALLTNDLKPDVDCVSRDDFHNAAEAGCTPLQLACIYWEPECVKVLLDAGANPKFKKGGDDAVDILLRTQPDSADAYQCLRLLLSYPHNALASQVNDRRQNRLHSIREKTPVSIVQLLVEAGTPLDTRDRDGYTPLAIAIGKGNESAAKYIIEQGANTNVSGPGFDSILHLAVAKGMLNLVKLLINVDADGRAVDLENGEPLLYTALSIEDDSKLKEMVLYLVDEAKVSIERPGGKLGYPIIRAAEMTRTKCEMGTKILKFLIRRKAELNVADRYGRRALHFACTSQHNSGIKALLDAGADINVRDKCGRMPIHFAASTLHDNCIEFLLDRYKDMDMVNVADYDDWTPLLWAARSGSDKTVTQLVARGADIWARGHDRWSALKLMNFVGRDEALRGYLEPRERTRINQDGEREEWGDISHETQIGDAKGARCQSCLVKIIGIQWKCTMCADDVSLCFKCYSYESNDYSLEHHFEEVGPQYMVPSGRHTRRNDLAAEAPSGDAGERSGQDFRIGTEVQSFTESDYELESDEFESDEDTLYEYYAEGYNT